MPTPLRLLLRLFLRIFFRRIDIVGAERVPAQAPLLLVLNHPNSLIDPLFVLCLAPRPVSFLAKAPLFRTPVVAWFVRAARSIPVERRQDPGADLTRNRLMFARVREHLGAGGAAALFPEGMSHSDPRLKPMKSGAARIALGVRSAEPLRIQAVGLVYTAKETFRSSALVAFGEPFLVEPAELDEQGEPPGNRVDALTARIAAALGAVTLQADEAEVLDLVERTEAILTSAEAGADTPEAGLGQRVERRRRLLSGYRALQASAPLRLERLRRRVLRYEARRAGAGVDPWDVPVEEYSPRMVIVATLLLAARFALLLPLGLIGLLLHYPAYRATGLLAARLGSREREVRATAKAITAFFLFPLTWAAAAVLAAGWWGAAGAIVTLVLAPVTGWMALRLTELWDRVVGAARGLVLFLAGRRRFVHLQVERRALRDELRGVAAELEAGGPAAMTDLPGR
ncbi:MAG: 1-acyl-sn-glycerol-3-phosphate acyltransferase [Gemmatimonadales bacterium]